MEYTDIVVQISCMILIGFAAGFLGSILGIGGAMFVTPVIILLFNVDIKVTIATCIVVVIATSSGSTIAYLKDNILNLRAAMFLEIFTTSGGIVGALLTGILAPWILYILFGMLLCFSTYNQIKKLIKEKGIVEKIATPSKASIKLRLNNTYFDENLKKRINYNVSNVWLGSLIMFGAGIASGLLGIGSGVFKVIAMDNVMKMPLKPSSATSNLMMGVTAASSAIVYFFKGAIQPTITAPVSIGVIFGATVGSKVMPKMPQRIIRLIFIPTVAFFAVQMIIKAVECF